ncbi:hypothetical protein HRG_001882 [Hirsutella rhossiliensis]|uniref:Uncharacterized protein n=1 Tax=Hirsutella rhossiliensis TaxID=111463 RepID=A0A9P8N1I2_9HYPO|nr:uncharacterized protein HRG_01882 [Hirsutella rhossiliensis]KAH0966473.1 hypothetical protein HRG_01882 [Hirsutella rhossiliensis]
MGPPRTRAQNLAAAAAAAAAAAQSRSRFLEGSMNDRASAVPPVAFLGPAERAALERPVLSAAADGAGGGGEDAARQQRQQQRQQQQQGRRAAGKMRLGLVWEGVRGRLRRRREAAGGEDGAGGRKKSSSSSSSSSGGHPQGAEERKPCDGGADRPSREEVLASYHQLVSAGFFANHAVYSTRRPPPGTPARPATAHESRPRSPNQQRQQQEQQQPPPCPGREAPLPPQWPLARKAPRATPASPVCSPASLASSRGTKRPAADDDDDDDDDDDEGAARSPPAQQGEGDEDASTLAHRFLPKRLRRSTSRDISLPRVRAPRRSTSAAATTGATSRNPPKRLARLALPVNAPGSAAGTRASLAPAAVPRRPSGPRNLRPRIVGGPLSVVPDANRGIPRVPAIPAKFAENQENDDDCAPPELRP